MRPKRDATLCRRARRATHGLHRFDEDAGRLFGVSGGNQLGHPRFRLVGGLGDVSELIALLLSSISSVPLIRLERADNPEHLHADPEKHPEKAETVHQNWYPVADERLHERLHFSPPGKVAWSCYRMDGFPGRTKPTSHETRKGMHCLTHRPILYRIARRRKGAELP